MLTNAANSYLEAGLCVLPAKRAQKRPALPWKQYQQRLPTAAELSAWIANARNGPDAICILCGAISGNLEMIDFDAGGESFSAWWERLPANLRDRLVVETSPSGGYHVIYRCEVAICGNLKLAQRKEGDKIVTLIETRGEGGLFLCAPTPGYELIQGDLRQPPVLTAAEREALLQAAWDLNEYVPPVVNGPRHPSHNAIVGESAASSVAHGEHALNNSHIGDCRSHNADIGACSLHDAIVSKTSASSAAQGNLSADISHIGACRSHNGNQAVDISNIASCSSHRADLCQRTPSSVAQGDHAADNSHTGACSPDSAARPGDDFNIRGDVRTVLEQHGWLPATERHGANGNEYWRRPGKDSGWSATLKDCSGGHVFYVFSSNAAPFEPNRAYSPFSVYTMLNHGGDFEQAARSLRQLGYGGDTSNLPSDGSGGVDISALLAMSVAQGQGASNIPHNDACHSNNSGVGEHRTDITPLPAIRSLTTLIAEFKGLHAPVVHGLLREGETMNVIAAPKMGKSWLTIGLATCIASGLDWLGLTVEQGRVLHIDNELHEPLLSSRYMTVSQAMGLPYRLYSHNIDMISLRGRLQDLYAMGRQFMQIEPGVYKLVIIDAFYRTLPRDTDENDNGAIANLYNHIDYHAARLKSAFVLIHHTSKGNQSGKSVTDVGAGAGSQSRAADTHLVLRPHEEEGIVVLESAVRSWPPMPPQSLRWQWPLFTACQQVDSSALQGAAKPKPKTRAVDLETFTEQCVAGQDPCSKRAVCYEAAQRWQMSDRKAEQMLDLAMERGLVLRIQTGSSMRYVKNRGGQTGDKAQWTAALLAHGTDESIGQIAKTVGVSERYVRQIRNENKGLTAELENDPVGTEFRKNAVSVPTSSVLSHE